MITIRKQNGTKFQLYYVFHLFFFISSLDPLGEKHALKTLELERGVTQEEIKARYRELSKKWHPDRFTDEQEKIEASDKFVLIQQSYERLSTIKKRRKTATTVHQTDDSENERRY